MTLDELISVLQDIREKHGGGILVGSMTDEGTSFLLKKEDNVIVEEWGCYQFFDKNTNKMVCLESKPGLLLG